MLGADQESPGIDGKLDGKLDGELDGELDGYDAQQPVVDDLKEAPKVLSDDRIHQSGCNW